ncbi:amino acid ABC transporter permease [Acinetobacter pollinis]|uniref:Amino acid ABC transporter permease n=1 Tax=Acinetobacter pollinis TaxID=2605270 RepID=A0ABU6DUK3_9GAMM|nr:amino acid ABC transporter permease [Acinetobacter pollinis]MBF7689620.1 amino acid ABC transporter permease [Acinetobacter pollinis]MBF7692662.1 amino acid ABC transporter permease [Acinetobacter pollinis]MBF7698239.1 amino acid ABC transporter permease [Acinetobacter pollinis]MBF7700648.1 amino acid ABC transporter permease [Acinetobacter pollinis]MEB5477332.1 amino acid ABC transporter permease [Acinetobacter pollinis]
MAKAFSSYKIIKAKYPLRYVGSAISILFILIILESVFFNDKWEWSVFRLWFFDPAVINGLYLTLKLTFSAMFLSFFLGGILAMMRLSTSWLVRGVAWSYIWLFRSVPLLVVLIILYNFSYLYERIAIAIPFTEVVFASYKTVNALDQFTTALIGLAIVQSAYTAEIIRGGILSVDKGQSEAAAALGLSWWHKTYRIIFPQAIRGILPALVNECISLSKGTAIVYVLAMPELFYTVQMVYNRNQQIIPLLMVAAVWYTIITSVFSVVQYFIESKLSRNQRKEKKSLKSMLGWGKAS